MPAELARVPMITVKVHNNAFPPPPHLFIVLSCFLKMGGMLLSAFVTIVAGLAHGVMLLHLHSVQRYDSKYVDSLGWFFGHRRHCRHSPYMCMYLYMRKLKKGKKSCSALGLSRCDALTRTYLPCVLCPANGRLHYRACALILLWGGSCAFGFYRNGCVCCRVQHKGHFVYQLGNFLDCTHLYL